MIKKALITILCILAAFSAGCQKVSDQAVEKQPQEAVGIMQFAPPKAGDTVAIMHTSMGDIKIKFFKEEAPKAVENFIELSKKDYYDGLTFHRVINEFMLQGGDPEGTGRGGTSIYGKPFEDEFSNRLHNFRGALSMANSGANTNQSQFFIVQRKEPGEKVEQWMRDNNVKETLFKAYQEKGGTPWLDNKHTVFAQVFEGMEIVDHIAQVEVDKNSKPLKAVIIEDVEITTYK